MTDKTTIARPYARAAFAAAQARGFLPAWSDALHTAATVVGIRASRASSAIRA